MSQKKILPVIFFEKVVKKNLKNKIKKTCIFGKNFVKLENNFLKMKNEIIAELLKKAENLKNDGQHKKAIKILEKIVTTEPQCETAFEEIGDNFLSLKNLPKAEKALRHALKLNSNLPNARYLLGFLHSLKQNWRASILELQKANQLFPNNPEILRCLGWSFYNQNRKNQGIAILERSRTLAPEDVNILCDLGVCYMNFEKISEARKIFLQIIKLDPESEQARDSIEFLRIIDGKNFS